MDEATRPSMLAAHSERSLSIPRDSMERDIPARRYSEASVTRSSFSSRATSFDLPLQGSCPRCSHFHHKVPLRLSRAKGIYRGVQCEQCQHNWFGLGGLVTRESLLSQETIVAIETTRTGPRSIRVCRNGSDAGSISPLLASVAGAAVGSPHATAALTPDGHDGRRPSTSPASRLRSRSTLVTPDVPGAAAQHGGASGVRKRSASAPGTQAQTEPTTPVFSATTSPPEIARRLSHRVRKEVNKLLSKVGYQIRRVDSIQQPVVPHTQQQDVRRVEPTSAQAGAPTSAADPFRSPPDRRGASNPSGDGDRGRSRSHTQPSRSISVHPHPRLHPPTATPDPAHTTTPPNPPTEPPPTTQPRHAPAPSTPSPSPVPPSTNLPPPTLHPHHAAIRHGHTLNARARACQCTATCACRQPPRPPPRGASQPLRPSAVPGHFLAPDAPPRRRASFASYFPAGAATATDDDLLLLPSSARDGVRSAPPPPPPPPPPSRAHEGSTHDGSGGSSGIGGSGTGGGSDLLSALLLHRPPDPAVEFRFVGVQFEWPERRAELSLGSAAPHSPSSPAAADRLASSLPVPAFGGAADGEGGDAAVVTDAVRALRREARTATFDSQDTTAALSAERDGVAGGVWEGAGGVRDGWWDGVGGEAEVEVSSAASAFGSGSSPESGPENGELLDGAGEEGRDRAEGDEEHGTDHEGPPTSDGRETPAGEDGIEM